MSTPDTRGRGDGIAALLHLYASTCYAQTREAGANCPWGAGVEKGVAWRMHRKGEVDGIRRAIALIGFRIAAEEIRIHAVRTARHDDAVAETIR